LAAASNGRADRSRASGPAAGHRRATAWHAGRTARRGISGGNMFAILGRWGPFKCSVLGFFFYRGAMVDSERRQARTWMIVTDRTPREFKPTLCAGAGATRISIIPPRSGTRWRPVIPTTPPCARRCKPFCGCRGRFRANLAKHFARCFRTSQHLRITVGPAGETAPQRGLVVHVPPLSRHPPPKDGRLAIGRSAGGFRYGRSRKVFGAMVVGERRHRLTCTA